MNASTGAGSATPAAAATGRWVEAIRSARSCSSAAAPIVPIKILNGRSATWRRRSSRTSGSMGGGRRDEPAGPDGATDRPRDAEARELGPALPVRARRGLRLHRQPARLRHLRRPDRPALHPGRGDRLLRRGHQQLLVEPALDLRRQARPRRLPGGALLHSEHRGARGQSDRAGAADPSRDARPAGPGDRDRDRDAVQLHRQQAVDVRQVRLVRVLPVCAAFALIAFLLLPGSAEAQHQPTIPQSKAISIARDDPKAIEALREHPDLSPSATRNENTADWEVGFYADGDQLVQVVVDDVGGGILESWSGYQ